MFHTYVVAHTGRKVDFHRARLLMDRDLLRAAIKAMNADKRHDATHGPQWVWEHYCSHHFEKYGAPFLPDADPAWDT